MTITDTNIPAVTETTDITETTDSGRRIGDILGGTRSAVGQVRDTVVVAVNRVPEVLESAKSGVDQVAEQVPAAVENTRVAAQRTTVSLQALPETTLRLIAGASMGLAAGLTLAGAPRLVGLMALVPALFVGGALATRPETDRKSI
jgi:hypothetical protein